VKPKFFSLGFLVLAKYTQFNSADFTQFLPALLPVLAMETNRIEVIKSLNKFPWLSLTLFWLAYTLVGWILAAQHIVWFVGVFIAVATVALVWTSSPWLGGLIGDFPQVLLVVLIVSSLVALAATQFIFFTLIFIPFITTFLAWQDMLSLNFKKSYSFWLLVAIALLSLGIGELIDIFVLPSLRY